MADALRSILLMESDTPLRESLATQLRRDVDCVVLEAANQRQAESLLATEEICLLVAGLVDGRPVGAEFLKTVMRINPQVVTLAGVPAGDVEAPAQVLKAGAFFYLHAPFRPDEAVIAVARGLYHYDLTYFREKRGGKIRKSDGFLGIIGESPPMRELFSFIEKIAEEGSSTVLLQGENGTGKELVARAIHALSPRRGKNFVPLNCAAIPEELLESELFGHARGAFTGAVQAKMGRIQHADGGTLFLDEIGDMRPALQAKLLRVLQEREIEPVGEVRSVKVDVRVIAATNRDLERAMADGTFREDLYYRLAVIPLTMPPLRQRREDIPLLIDKFVQVYNRNRKNRLRGFTAEAQDVLRAYPWPGNVRELENLVQRMAIFYGGKSVTPAELPPPYRRADPQPAQPPPRGPETAAAMVGGDAGAAEHGEMDFNALVDAYERQLIGRALAMAAGSKKEAARLLRLNRTTLIEKMKKKGLS